MTWQYVSLGKGHRISIGTNALVVEHIDLNKPGKWETNICFWQEDINPLKEAIKKFESIIRK